MRERVMFRLEFYEAIPALLLSMFARAAIALLNCPGQGIEVSVDLFDVVVG